MDPDATLEKLFCEGSSPPHADLPVIPWKERNFTNNSNGRVTFLSLINILCSLSTSDSYRNRHLLPAPLIVRVAGMVKQKPHPHAHRLPSIKIPGEGACQQTLKQCDHLARRYTSCQLLFF